EPATAKSNSTKGGNDAQATDNRDCNDITCRRRNSGRCPAVTAARAAAANHAVWAADRPRRGEKGDGRRRSRGEEEELADGDRHARQHGPYRDDGAARQHAIRLNRRRRGQGPLSPRLPATEQGV